MARPFLVCRRDAPPALALLLALVPLGCAGWPGMVRPALREAPELRFIEPSDLGIAGGPMALDVVYSIHPGVLLDPKAIRWETPAAEHGVDPHAAFRTLTRNVLAEAFRTAVETAPGSHVRLEQLQRSLPSPDPELKELPPLNAKALVLIDFRPPLLERPDLAGQLVVHLYDISFPRYEDLSLSGPRLLIFEDYAEITRLERPSKLVGALVMAWREILERMRSSDRFRRYLALCAKPLDRGDQEWAFLLGLVSRDRIPSAPDSQLHEWIEKEILFPSPHEEVQPPAAPAPEPSSAAPLLAPEAATKAPESTGTEKAPPPEPVFTGEPVQERSPPAASGDEGKSAPPTDVHPGGEPAPAPGRDPHSPSDGTNEDR